MDLEGLRGFVRSPHAGVTEFLGKSRENRERERELCELRESRDSEWIHE
jgi:hypothetical protein